VQTTTVDPGGSYAGKIVVEKIKDRTLPQRVTITVNWNGEQYPFAFRLAKPGTPAPVFADAAPAAMKGVSAALPARVQGQAPLRPVPAGIDMEAIVRRTAEVMPRPTTLDDGTKLTRFEASGTELIVTAAGLGAASSDPETLRRAAHSAICTARPFGAILYQGGSVRAVFPGRKQTEPVQATAATCRAA